MRWKLLRRRLSVSAPRVMVRSRLPWPVRWMSLALAMGFSAALALWAYEFGKDIAGLDRDAKKEVQELRAELSQLRAEHERAVSVANSADTLLKAERAAQESLAARVKSLEADNLALTRDLGFFEKLVPSAASKQPLALRGLQIAQEAPGRVRYQAVLMQSAGRTGEFKGFYQIQLSGTQAGKPWAWPQDASPRSRGEVSVKQYQRLEGVVEFAAGPVVKQLEIKVMDANGQVQATEVVRL
jgi:hypothetical protein